MKTISIVNLKGGVGKTVTAVNLAAILATEYGARVLLIDAASRASAASAVRWLAERVGRRSLPAIQPIAALIYAPLMRCWMNVEHAERRTEAGRRARLARMCSIGGWRTACCRGKLDLRRLRNDEGRSKGMV